MTWIADGVSLSTLAWNVKNRSAGWKVPGRRGANLVLPGVHGAQWTPGKPYEQGNVVLTMWAAGCNLDGSVPTDKNRRKKMEENLDALTRLFATPSFVLSKTRADGTTRSAFVEVVAAIDFTSMAGGTRAEFGVEMVVPGSFWLEAADTTQTVLVGGTGAQNKVLSFSSFDVATAPLVGAQYEVLGPANWPKLTDPVTGQWVQLEMNLGASVRWTVDSGLMTSVSTTNVNRLSVTRHGLGSSFLDMSRSSLRFSASGGVTAATSVKVTGKRGFMVA